jgi:hypothetical protein
VTNSVTGRGKTPRWDSAATVAAPRSVLIPRERTVQERGGRRVHQFAALDLVHHRDPRVRVSEQFCRELDAGVLVDRGRHRAAEHVRGHPVDPGFPEHLPQLTAHVRGGQRRAVPGLEQQSSNSKRRVYSVRP